MRLSSLSFAAVLLVSLFSAFSISSLAQHGGGGGGGGGSSGGSHGGGGGSSSGSSGGHASGGSASHGSSAHSSSAGPSAVHPAPSKRELAPTVRNEPIHESRVNPEKRGFFSIFHHPFHHHHPNPHPAMEVEFHRRVCLNGICRICPVAQVPGVHGCATPQIPVRHNTCSNLAGWAGNACAPQTSFVEDCSGLRMTMQRQAERMQAADAARHGECING